MITVVVMTKANNICLQIQSDYMVHTDPGTSWKVVVFEIQHFRFWKVIESRLGAGKSCKINQMVAAT